LGSFGRERVAHPRPGRACVFARRLPAVRAAVQGGVRLGQKRIRRIGVRVVQRSKRLLPGLRPAGGGAGDGIFGCSAHGRGVARVRHGNSDEKLRPAATSATGDAAALVAALEAGLSRHFARPRRVEQLDRRPSLYGTSFAIEELDVTLDGGERCPLVLKDLAWRSLLPDASAVRPHFLHDPRREIDVYLNLLAGRALGTAACHGVPVDERAGRYWLILERVEAAKLCHVGDLSTWTVAARWLATLHATFAQGVKSLVEFAPLLVYNRAFYALWPARAEKFLRNGPCGAATRSNLARIIGRYDRLAQTLADLDRSLIHGDFYASNILVRTTPMAHVEHGSTRARICPVDWELAAVGPPLIDLAALTAGKWSVAEREAMVDAYRDSLAEAGQPMLPRCEMHEALDWCRLHLAFQWLGWAADWDAPADQAQDWLGEAVRVAARLGL
jgi:hypothetical protein